MEVIYNNDIKTYNRIYIYKKKTGDLLGNRTGISGSSEPSGSVISRKKDNLGE